VLLFFFFEKRWLVFVYVFFFIVFYGIGGGGGGGWFSFLNQILNWVTFLSFIFLLNVSQNLLPLNLEFFFEEKYLEIKDGGNFFNLKYDLIWYGKIIIGTELFLDFF